MASDIGVVLSEASGVPFYRQIVDQITEMVQSGHLSEGTKLPSVRGLASNLVVSLITTRRAYADLEAAKLIIRKQGQGTFVAPQSDTQSLRDNVRATAVTGLTNAVLRGRRVGLSGDEVRETVDRALEPETGGHGDE